MLSAALMSFALESLMIGCQCFYSSPVARSSSDILLQFLDWTTCFLKMVCNCLQRVWDMFSLVWWVCQKCQPNQQQHKYKPRGIKETAHTMGRTSEVIYKCVCCSSVYATLEDIRRHVWESYSNVAYQHDDDEFVSKCNIIQKSKYIVCTYFVQTKYFCYCIVEWHIHEFFYAPLII